MELQRTTSTISSSIGGYTPHFLTVIFAFVLTSLRLTFFFVKSRDFLCLLIQELERKKLYPCMDVMSRLAGPSKRPKL